MESHSQQQSLRRPDLQWELVRRWKRKGRSKAHLSGEAKLAWLYIWVRAGRRPGTIVVTAAGIAEDQGTGERSGLRALQNLIDFGLLEEVEACAGTWTIYVPEPQSVARARRDAGNTQQEFGAFAEDPDGDDPEGVDASSADVVQHPPSVAPPLHHKEKAHAQGHPTSHTSQTSISDVGVFSPATRCATSAATSAPTNAKPRGRAEVEILALKAIAAVKSAESERQPIAPQAMASTFLARAMAAIERQPDEAAQADRVQRLADLVLARINDPHCYRTPILRVSQAVIDGRFPLKRLLQVLGRLDDMDSQGILRKGRGPWTVCTLRVLFQKAGLNWPETKPREVRA